jgi:hypothetical protein
MTDGPDTGRPTAEEPLICSAKGCQATATVALLWNNPKIHPPERRKTWLACAEHREELERFLGTRGFLREVVGCDDLGEVAL